MKKTLLLFCLSTLSHALGAQEGIKKIAPCIDSLLNSICSTTSYVEMDVKFTKDGHIILTHDGKEHFVEYNQEEELLSPIGKKTARAYQISAHDKTIFALSHIRLGATKLESNYTTWLLTNRQMELIIEYTSLSPSVKQIYFDEKTHNLHVARIFYGSNYYWTRDNDNMDLVITIEELRHGIPIELIRKNTKCR